MTIKLEFVGSNLKYDLGIYLGMDRIRDASDESRHDAANKVFEERAGCQYEDTSHSIESDRATKDITAMFSHEEDFCNVHDCEKMEDQQLETRSER